MAQAAADDPFHKTTKALKDVLYVGIGFGLIALQKAQVQRQDLSKLLDRQVTDARAQFQGLGSTFDDRVKLVEERLEGVEDQVESLLDQFEEKLPEQARDLVKTARDAARDAQGQLRVLTGRRNGTAA